MDITQDLASIDAEPFETLWAPDAFFPPNEVGITKHSAELGRDAKLDALFVNRNADVLIVSMHGATQRATIKIPRFERLRTFLRTPYSSVYFGDPSLYLRDNLSLSWFTGWRETNVPHIVADWVQKAAHASGASKIVFVGSSGGGFASAQVATHVPGSVAVVYNPQTLISAYRPNGSLGYGRNYIRSVMPELTPPAGLSAIDATVDWASPIGDRASMLKRYSRPVSNRLVYVQNDQDLSHWHDHYLPFRRVVEGGVNRDRVRFHVYTGAEGHSAPPQAVFDATVKDAMSWIGHEAA